MRRYHFHGPDFEENGLGELPDTPKPLYLQSRFWGGIICPLLVGGYGLFSIVTFHSFLFVASRHQFFIELFDLEAVYSGIIYLMGGLFFHFTYYWKQSEKFFQYAMVLAYLSLIIGGVSLFLLCWHLSSFKIAVVVFGFIWIYLMILPAGGRR